MQEKSLMITNNWQQNFIDNYISARRGKSILVAKTGTGKTFTAMQTGLEMINNGFADAIYVLTDFKLIQQQWAQMFDSELKRGISGDNYKCLTIQEINSAPQKILGIPENQKTFFIIDELRSYKSVENLIPRILKKNNDNKVLFLASLPITSLTFDQQFSFDKEYIYQPEILCVAETKIDLITTSPSIGILDQILKGKINIDNLSWRQFEILISQLLEKDGYYIELMRGTKDGGVDVIASKNLGISGTFQTIWQAKKKLMKNKVGLSVIRELSDTRNEFKASKAIIVTSTFLTRDALMRVERDKYILGKVDRNDLINWMDKLYK